MLNAIAPLARPRNEFTMRMKRRRMVKMTRHMPTTLQLGVLASTLSPDIAESARLAREAGFSGLLFDAVSTGLDFTELSVTGRRDFRRVIGQQGQQIIGLSVSAGTDGMSRKADVDRVLNRLEQIFAAAVGIQSMLVCLELGPVPVAAEEVRVLPRVTAEQAGLLLLPDPPAAAPAANVAAPKIDVAAQTHFDAALKELAARADRNGVMLALRSDLANFAALDRAMSATDCPWFGIDLDPVALLQDDWPADEVFSRLGSRIRHVRARDAQAGGQSGSQRRTRPVAIGRGATEWNRLLAQLADCGYHGWLTVDSTELANRQAAAVAAAEYLKPLLVG